MGIVARIEENKITVYAAISAVLGVIALLNYINNDWSSFYLIIFILVYTLASLEYFLEWRYYRSHGALLASMQFIILPYLILVSGNLWTHKINSTIFVNLNVNILSIPSFYIILNLMSLTLLVPFYITHKIFYFYHSKRWNGFAIRRKLFRGRRVPLVLDSFLSLALLFLGFETGIFDGMVMIFIGRYVYQIMKYYILASFFKNQHQSRWLDTFLSNSDPAPRNLGETFHHTRNSSQSPSSQNQSGRTIPVSPRNGQRRVSHQYTNARKINPQSNPPPSLGSSSRSKKKAAQRLQRTTSIDPGMEIGTKRSNGFSDEVFLPSGNVSKSDLSCIFCYEPIKSKDQNIVICPHCKYPSHEDEYQSWFTMSGMCARCSKIITKQDQNSSKYRFKAKDYKQKVVDKL